MTPASLKEIAASNQWAAIYPEISLGLLAVALLVLEVLLPKSRHGLLPRLAIVGQLAIAGFVLFDLPGRFVGQPIFDGLLRQTDLTQPLRLFFLLASILVCFLGQICLPRQAVPRVEFYHLILVVTAAMMLLSQSSHFGMLFVALETVTVGFYVLVSYYRRSALSLEAGLKYLIQGALSSALLLFGIVLLYGAASNPALEAHTARAMHFADLRLFLAANPDDFLALVGAGLVISGVAFKIGAVPFQIWIPDVYQGAPTPVTAFLAVSSKAAGVALLLQLVQTVFATLHAALLGPLLTFMAIATLLFGNFAALTQRNVKRLMGLSGVSHAGYLLLGILASSGPAAVSWAPYAIYFYLLTYLLGAFAVFGVMAYVADADDAHQDIDHYMELARHRPFLAGVLSIGLGSLAGIPPLAGFIGKLLLFVAAFQAHQYALLAVAVFSVVVSIYYYFGWMKAAWFETWKLPGQETATPAETRALAKLPSLSRFTLAALALATLLLGFFQGPLGRWLAK